MGQFGTHAQALLAVKRVFDMLTNESGRMRVLQCMKQKVPLHGRAGQDGIPGCTMIWNENGIQCDVYRRIANVFQGASPCVAHLFVATDAQL